MPTYQFKAMDSTGQEIEDVIDAATEEEATTSIRSMGYYVTKISVKKAAAGQTASGARKRKGFTLGGASTKVMTTFTRQLSILQDAGLPILRSLKILESNNKPGKLKNALMDVCDEIETGSTLSEAMAKSPKVFNRLYINMVKAGEAGGALEIILQRLADFMERSQSLKKKVKGAMIYPIVVILVATGILTFIMIKIVPVFAKMFEDFELELPAPTLLLVNISNYIVRYWYMLLIVPLGVWISLKLIRKFKAGKMGWDMFVLKIPVLGKLVEKNIMGRTTRTLGTLVSSGVPILEALNITRETAGSSVFERLYGKVSESIREGETISRPMEKHSKPGFHPVALFFWLVIGVTPGVVIMLLPEMLQMGASAAGGGAVVAGLFYFSRMNSRVVDDLVVNMVDVGEETGELDTMLFKVADTFDEDVKTLTDGLMALMEPLLIVFLGGAVGFIVIALFMPLVKLIQGLS